jgi:hypothetical protein
LTKTDKGQKTKNKQKIEQQWRWSQVSEQLAVHTPLNEYFTNGEQHIPET